MSVRVRFAPSPTGHLHIGGLRTAIYNYLFAKQNKGTMILRIEDTDRTRLVEGAIKNLISSLQWAGIEFSEGPGIESQYGPYIQSKRLDIYNKTIQQLINSDRAYPCFCSHKRLEDVRNFQKKNNTLTGYDGQCRTIDKSEYIHRMEIEKHVIRLKTPDKGKLDYIDIIRGKIEFDLSLVEDQILIKSDGYPTYHFANVIDDYYMKITHVIRGDEWISSMPKHLLIYKYLEWKPPIFAHLPLILNKNKTKLSKRQNDVSAEDYIKKGYLPEAVINYLSLLGWHPSGNREIFNMEELIQEFSLDRINKSGAIFDIQKFNWMNSHYIKSYKFSTIFKLCSNFIPNTWKINESMLKLVLEKLERLSDIKEELEYFFDYNIESEESNKTINTATSQRALKEFNIQISLEKNLKSEQFKDIMKSVQTKTKIKGKELWMPIRIALTGRMHGPDLGEISEILGLETCVSRVNEQIQH